MRAGRDKRDSVLMRAAFVEGTLISPGIGAVVGYRMGAIARCAQAIEWKYLDSTLLDFGLC